MRSMSGLEKSLLVTETFTSLQGEGNWAGYPCFFIRLTGCNLRCTYCDTKYSYEGGQARSVWALLKEWQDSGVPLVQVTGGEPLLQDGVYALLEALVDKGATVLLETNGSISLKGVPPQVSVALDRKTPGSGMESSWTEENLRFLGMNDLVKFVITDRADYQWALAEVERTGMHLYTQVLFSPAWGVLDPVELASWMVADKPQARMQLQLHKMIWGDKRGV